MAFDPHTHETGIQFDEALRRRVRELAEARGITPESVLREALEAYLAAQMPETAYDRLDRLGLIGCIADGPTDLSTNPAHMQGFGRG